MLRMFLTWGTIYISVADVFELSWWDLYSCMNMGKNTSRTESLSSPPSLLHDEKKKPPEKRWDITNNTAGLFESEYYELILTSANLSQNHTDMSSSQYILYPINALLSLPDDNEWNDRNYTAVKCEAVFDVKHLLKAGLHVSTWVTTRSWVLRCSVVITSSFQCFGFSRNLNNTR